MTVILAFATMSGIATLLQLSIPSYALRLVRRFGTQRVGWFLVVAFLTLSLIHLSGPLRALGAGIISGVAIDVLSIAGPILLLIAMWHMEIVFAEREHAKSSVESVRAKVEAKAKEEVGELSRANQVLRREIARREKTEAALRESEAQFRLVFSSNPHPMWIFDLNSCEFLAVNTAALEQYGLTEDEFMAMTVRDIFPPDAVLEFLQSVSKPCEGGLAMGLWQHCRNDGTLMDVEMSALDITFGGCPARLILAKDVSQRWRSELKFRDAQKMAMIGHVAGGVAHHFYPVITTIQEQTNVLLQKVEDPQIAEELNVIAAAVGHGSLLTQQLFAVGGQHPLELEAIDLNALIQNQSLAIRQMITAKVLIQNQFGPEVPLILADQQLVQHILFSLVMNALEAMPDGGTLTIRTTAEHFDQPQGAHSRTGDYVCLSVCDSGCGLAPTVQPHLFEPFFTTKETSAGLGLASVYGAVKQQAGWVELTSKVGVGTEFRVFLPCAPETAVPRQATTTDGESGMTAGTILLVDREERTRGLARCMLDWKGYRVLEADCGSLALLLWETETANVDMLITDLDLPGDISGRDLAEKLQQAKPGLRVIFTSQMQNGKIQEPVPVAGAQYISKPYSPEHLLKAVQN